MLQQTPQKNQSGSELLWENLWDDERVTIAFGASFEAFKKYLKLAKNTESAKQYHLWSLLSLTAATVSNRMWFDHGVVGRLNLNLGVVLTGRPAMRKSSAIGFMQRFAQELPINYGPTDTGGARHGIMAAMQMRWQDDAKDSEEDETPLPTTLDELAESNLDHIVAKLAKPRSNPSSIFFATKELGRILSSQTRELLDFFVDGLDGEPIFYRTKNGDIRIPRPLINLLGATTPDSLAQMMPRDAHGHGILSRLIFVYAGKNEREVPLPPIQTDAERVMQEGLLDSLLKIQTLGEGPIGFDEEAQREYQLLYSYTIKSTEIRLSPYAGRRPVHLIRIAALICLLRGDAPYRINKEDLGLAHLFLMITEADMDAAYMGMDKRPEHRVYAIIREVIEDHGPEYANRENLRSFVMRAGIDEKTFVQQLDLLTKMQKLKGEAGSIGLPPRIGLSTANLYLSRKAREKSG